MNREELWRIEARNRIAISSNELRFTLSNGRDQILVLLDYPNFLITRELIRCLYRLGYPNLTRDTRQTTVPSPVTQTFTFPATQTHNAFRRKMTLT